MPKQFIIIIFFSLFLFKQVYAQSAPYHFKADSVLNFSVDSFFVNVDTLLVNKKQAPASAEKQLSAKPTAKTHRDTVYFKQLNPERQNGNLFLSFDAGKQFTNFRFVNSGGAADKNYESIVSNVYCFSVIHNQLNGLVLRASTTFRHAGAFLRESGTDYQWDFQYIDINVGAGYKLMSTLVKPYIVAAPYIALLTDAHQSIGGVNYDIKHINAIKSNDFGLHLSAGASYAVSKQLALYAECRYLLGLLNLENNSSEKSRNRGLTASLGLSFKIPSTNLNRSNVY